MVLDKIFKNSEGEFISLIDILKDDNNFQNYIYTLAEAHAIDLIASTIAKCEIQTFELKDKKVQENRGDLYWTLNLQPNYNENGTNFLYKLMIRLLTEKTALVVINKKAKANLLYVADSYDCSKDILYGKTFTDVVISDNEGNSITMEKTYGQNNSIYYSLQNSGLTTASENFKTNAKKILKAAEKSFIRANTAKWKLEMPGNQPTMIDPETKKQIDYKEYINKITEGLFDDEESVLLLSQMFNLVNLNKDNNKDLSDDEKIVKRTMDTVAQKWKIPLDVFYGSKTEKSTGNDDFITFAVDIYFEIIEDGFNIVLVGKEGFQKGEYVKFNKLNLNHKDLFDRATNWDKLISNGFSFNQLCKLLKLSTIDEDWANEHYITKNYANVKGGAEEDE